MAQWPAALFLALVGCAQPGPLTPAHDGVPPPPGTPRVQRAIDPMTVGMRLMENGQYELAVDAFLAAIAEDGPSAARLSALGSAHLRLGRLGTAETLLREAVDLNPEAISAWNNLGVVLAERQRWAEAARAFRRAFTLDRGRSALIGDNLKLALAKSPDFGYSETNKNDFKLVRLSEGAYVLLPAPRGRAGS